jgi:hypothetical protein
LAQALRELVLSLKIKADKAGIKETDLAFDHAAKSAKIFENGAYQSLAPLKKIGEQLDANAKKARELAKALLPTGALPGLRPEAPSDRHARLAREAFGLDKVNPGDRAKLRGPNVAAFLKSDATPDFRTGSQKALGSLREGLASVGRSTQVAMAQASAAVDRFNAKFDGVVKAVFNARTAFAGLAIVLGATAVGRFVGDVVQAGAELHTMAQRTRMSVETLQVWREIAAGVNADAGAVTGAFQKLSKAINGAAGGGKAQAKAFKDLGVEFKGRQTEDVLIDVGAALAAMDDDAKASALAVQLLGPAGAALVPAFKGGADAVRKLTAELRENVVMTAEDAARLEEVGSAVERGEKKWTALKQRAIILLLPLLEALSTRFEKVSKWVLRMSKETSVLQTIFVALTGGALTRMVTGLAAWVSRVGGARAAMALFGRGLATVAGFAWDFILPMLLIEDFLTFLQGGKSVFGDAMNAIFGAGGADEKRQQILGFFKDLGGAVSGLATPLGAIADSALFKGTVKGALDGVLAVLNLIGFALASNKEKADALAEAFQVHASALGIAPSKEHVEDLNKRALDDAVAGKQPELSPFKKALRKGITSVFGDPLDDPKIKAENAHNAEVVARARMAQDGIVPTPAVPPQPKQVTLTDNRKIEVNVGANATPGATGRAVGGAVDETLAKDRRQTLNAL